MTEPVAAREPRKAPPDAALLRAACGIVGSAGLAGLALRPLADALGVSVTVLSKHYGARADIMAAICSAAATQEAPLLAQWRTLLAPLAALPAPLAAHLADTILDELATQQRALSLLYLELLHACTWDASLRPAFAAWDAQRRQFWQAFGKRADLAPVLLDCGWWHGYVVAELAYSMGLNGVTGYRLLRRLCLQRLFAGALAPATDAADATLFGGLLGQMQPVQPGRAEEGSAARPAQWHAPAARACGIRLAAQGIDGLTHRAIAADIGIPHTTLSYRFPAQHDLVLAGLEFIAAHIGSAVNTGSLAQLERMRSEGDGAKLDSARANFAVAIAAARMPGLVASTADMRSRRGNNLIKVFAQYLPQARGIDALCAQVVSLGLTGLTNTAPPGAASDAAVAAAFAAAARWLGKRS